MSAALALPCWPYWLISCERPWQCLWPWGGHPIQSTTTLAHVANKEIVIDDWFPNPVCIVGNIFAFLSWYCEPLKFERKRWLIAEVILVENFRIGNLIFWNFVSSGKISRKILWNNYPQSGTKVNHQLLEILSKILNPKNFLFLKSVDIWMLNVYD